MTISQTTTVPEMTSDDKSSKEERMGNVKQKDRKCEATGWFHVNKKFFFSSTSFIAIIVAQCRANEKKRNSWTKWKRIAATLHFRQTFSTRDSQPWFIHSQCFSHHSQLKTSPERVNLRAHVPLWSRPKNKKKTNRSCMKLVEKESLSLNKICHESEKTFSTSVLTRLKQQF